MYTFSDNLSNAACTPMSVNINVNGDVLPKENTKLCFSLNLPSVTYVLLSWEGRDGLSPLRAVVCYHYRAHMRSI